MVSHPPKQPSRSSQPPPRSTPHAKKGSASSHASDRSHRHAQDGEGLKNYQLGDCLGKGAFASVYRALNWDTGETVAVKQIRTEHLGQAELKTIMLEIDLLKSLSHPNIVRYNGFVSTSESLYIILEYCENGSLHSICKNFGKFPENLVALYMSQVLHGLLYLHEQGVIHRDIKGANILTTKEGLVKLADFGVATKQSGLDHASVVGTPYWMAPEVIELSGATTASDIWSVGCTVIELIEGKPPYHKLQPMQALFRIVNDDHPPIPGSASKYLDEFLMECFQKNPNLRIDAKRLLKHPWILSAKRTVPMVQSKPTEYGHAVKMVEEWNERLQSPEPGPRGPRLVHGYQEEAPLAHPPAAVPARRPAVNVNHLDIPKHRPTAESFRSPDMDSDDNVWDDDFDESVSERAFHQSHLKPQDNFAGLFSSDKLKAYASFDAVAEEPSHLDGEATVKSPLNLQHLRGISSVFGAAGPMKASSAKAKVSTSRSTSSSTVVDDRREGQPKTAYLKGVPKGKVAALARPSQMFRENSVEDYSDLTPADDGAFEMKLRAMQNANPPSMLPKEDQVKPVSSSPADVFSPKLFHPSDLKTAPKSTRDNKANGARQRSASSTSTRKMQRSQSEIEIQKYAEDDRDDFSDVFGELRRPDSDCGSEHSSMAILATKMTSSFIISDDDDLDPFANMDDGLENINMENNVARDRDDRLVKQTENLVDCLKSSQPGEDLLEVAEQLLQVLYESPDKRSVVLRCHGMLPILETLGNVPPPDAVLPLLQIINLIILEDADSQESLSFLGGIPIICNYASKKYPSDIRKEAAAFVRQMYTTGGLTLPIFIGCGGINVLVEFLEEDIDAERDLVLIGVNGMWNVFEYQGSAPKNDFCRIFARRSVLYPLSLVLNRMVVESGEVSRLVQGRIVSIFLIFSQAESHVKDLVADRMILKRKSVTNSVVEHC
jgi:serine/threonine protein kinase